MARIVIDGNHLLSYETTARSKYWRKLSDFIIAKYGKKEYRDPSSVEAILMDSFQFLCNEFKVLIKEETKLGFFLYTFWLNEESNKLYLKTLGGLELKLITRIEFARYRRILKLIMEQGCDIDMLWGKFPDAKEVVRLDAKIQALLYLGTWMYGFADYIAFQKMIEECHFISFVEEDYLSIDWQYHYGVVHNELFPKMLDDYKKGTIDDQGMADLKAAIEKCFGIQFNFALGQIHEIKKHHNPEDPDLQSIEPWVLPKNLAHAYGISEEQAALFYSGLTLSRTNKMSLENTIYKPYSMDRYMFRPILIYKIEGVDRAFIGDHKFAESLSVLSTNAMHWNALPKEWLKNRCMQLFMNKKGHEHDKILEDKVEGHIKEKNFMYCRNIKSFKQRNGININIDNSTCGEIDFIVVSPYNKTIYVADSKYNRARYEAVGFRSDNTNFLNDYEAQLSRKVNWVAENVAILQQHLEIIYNVRNLNISQYEVEGIFFINTPTFYMYNGEFKAITLKHLPQFLDGAYQYPNIIHDDGENLFMVQHPYFRKPIILDFPEEDIE